ncbi:MAG: ACP S-malonyltransferase [Anaerolineales bacterium]
MDHLATSVAFLFPGQGSQFVGMGKDLALTSDSARAAFETADSTLGYSLSKLCWEGPEADLNQTLHTQPAILVHSVAAWRAFQERVGNLRPRCLAGHSLGEFSALVAAGALEFRDALHLVRERARLMTEAGERSPGGMAALLNLGIEEAQKVCEQAAAETGEVVQVANDNCPGQVVISGTLQALERAMSLAKERGARRALRLAVSIAAHSPLMRPAAGVFARTIQSTPISQAGVPVIANVTAEPISQVSEIREELEAQLTSPVQWTRSVRKMVAEGCVRFIELGPKDVLTGLGRRIAPEVPGLSIGTAADLAAFDGV